MSAGGSEPPRSAVVDMHESQSFRDLRVRERRGHDVDTQSSFDTSCSVTEPVPPPSAEEKLRAFFRRNGYVREADLAKRRASGSQSYKKGYEVRLVLESEAELREVARALKVAGIAAGKPFTKHSKLIQPIYGKAAVAWFREE